MLIFRDFYSNSVIEKIPIASEDIVDEIFFTSSLDLPVFDQKTIATFNTLIIITMAARTAKIRGEFARLIARIAQVSLQQELVLCQ